MVTHSHEVPIRLFQARPELAAELLVKTLGAAIPAYASALSESEALTNNDPLELNCDNAAVFRSEAGVPVFAVIIEVQRHQDNRKQFSWPMYVTILRARLQCPVRLLAVCTDEATADWARRPIEVGPPGFTLLPDVINPEELLEINEDRSAVGAVEILILKAACGGPQAEQVAHRLGRRLNELSESDRQQYAGWAMQLLSTEACNVLEEYMSMTYQEYLESPAGRLELKGEARGEVRGKALGKAEAVLELLELRKVEVPDAARERILSCTDPDQADRWFTSAFSAHDVEAIFD
ncbi:hypothetical protein [Glycomyces artemisiae]|uniref:DUF4351 domain-containing protein n=1 Tax=Glycomyces artemisiae TaxID=1076443 RepID=A0A2T0UIS0_9ACTN|nr:hypothetical protein [Glycomyces artemisiae]PRY57766.1 hypothetical protein B0I28_106186 [Glycomyces artemisiae]